MVPITKSQAKEQSTAHTRINIYTHTHTHKQRNQKGNAKGKGPGGESGAGGDRDALADEGEATKDPMLGREHMHGSALATATATSLPE